MNELFDQGVGLMGNLVSIPNHMVAGISRYTTDFLIPYLLATQYFQRVESKRLLELPPSDSMFAYLDLLQNNIELMERSISGAARMMMGYAQLEMGGLTDAMKESWLELKYGKLEEFAQRQAKLLEAVTRDYPDAIESIAPEYGFHFEDGDHKKIDETDRFVLYRVSPFKSNVAVRNEAKPILIIPPYVLGANILGFLPGEDRSYAHCYANRGIPTYIRILKDIDTTPALQLMTGEDDAKDTRRFCETIYKIHGKQVTLNGYCQGGFNALCNLLSGELDDLVDAFITCVSPMDGTRSKGLSGFLSRLNPRFNDLTYGIKHLPNGNQVADGKLMGWVYKLKSIEHEIPAAVFFRDLMMFARQKNGDVKISKTAAALNYWLMNERTDLPMEITRISFASFNTPITEDGTLPVQLFGKKLNLKRLREKNLPWLICYGIHDDLVEMETALAPLDHVEAEVSPFPKGHVAIATSWSHPDSACALHARFGEGNYRGPVRFHMDLDESLTKARNLAAKKKSTPDKQTRETATSQLTNKSSVARKTSPSSKAKGTKAATIKSKQVKQTAKAPTSKRAAVKKTTATKTVVPSTKMKA